ncbi:MAG: hypothetical protein LWY06_20500, partial [Firmicutes bacterium]|nr:hypothetical protein [Bacillota bacterium]
DETKLRYISPCPNLILEVNSKDILCGFVIRDIISDPGYKLQKQWAKETGYTYPQTFPGIDRTRKVFFSNW